MRTPIVLLKEDIESEINHVERQLSYAVKYCDENKISNLENELHELKELLKGIN